MKATDVLSREEIKDLLKLSNLRGFFALATTWAMIIGSFMLVAYFPNILTFFIALIIIGGRHLALAILMHDASHYSLFKSKWMNDFFGSWFAAYFTWQDLRRYRVHHLSHHKNAGSEADPDLDLIKNFPTTRSSLRRKFLRDLLGVSGIKRLYGLLLMDLGFIEYTVSSRVTKISQSSRSPIEFITTAVRNLHGVVITNLVLFFILKFFNHGELYLLWIISYLCTFSLFVRIRSIAEHACTEMDLDPTKNTRTTHANFWARITVAPHLVNYHLEHHLLMTVPHFHFKKMHALLLSKNVFNESNNLINYKKVLDLATKVF